jgi:predicted MPP superfamily phosphohydrolase
LIAAWVALVSPLGERSAPIARAADAPPYHLVVLGDPHLPGKFLPAKERVLQTINSWADVDAVAVLGDICEEAGTAVEYAAAKQFFATLTKPAFFIAGNHDYIYKNPQVFLWVAGHMHVSATNQSFRSDVNVYERQVTTIHATDMNRERIWTDSLFFYPDRVVVKTFDHKTGAWMEKLARTVLPPLN